MSFRRGDQVGDDGKQKIWHCLIEPQDGRFVICFQSGGKQKPLTFHSLQDLVHNCVPLTHLYPDTAKEQAFPGGAGNRNGGY